MLLSACGGGGGGTDVGASGNPPPASGPAVDISSIAAADPGSSLPAEWQRGTFMQIFVRSYSDSDGDGIGDLRGVASKLDYLKDLGISGIWLMPITRSQDRDHGYATSDYRNVEAQYGSLADLDELLRQAHARGIGVIMDYVINHSSYENPLFANSRLEAGNAYRNWYLWQNPRPSGWNIYGNNPWYGNAAGYYFAAFWDQMPDWNLQNAAVVGYHHNNLRFWLNRGVDGFRFDAVGVLIENRAIAWENQPENHTVMKRIHALLDEYGKRYMVCEAPGDPAAFAAADSCGSAFAFGLQKHIIASIKLGRVKPDLLYTLSTQPVARMATLLANHDAFAGARLFKQFNGDEKSYRVAAATLLTLPGTPFIYYGEEIGLSHAEPVQQDDQAIRGPMSWSGQTQAGFSRGDKLFRPLVANWKTHNVEVQKGDPGSLLNQYRQLIELRKSEPALSVGSFTPLAKKDEPIFAFMREHEGSKILVLINYAYRDATLTLPAEFRPAQWKAVFPANGSWPSALKSSSGSAKAAPNPKGKKPAAQAAPASGGGGAGGPEIRMAPQQILIFKAVG